MFRRNSFAIVLAIAVGLLSAEACEAVPCNAEAAATTTISEPFDRVYTGRRATITQWLCASHEFYSVWLGRRVWRDSEPLHDWFNHTGERAEVGATAIRNGVYLGCDEVWMAQTRAGLDGDLIRDDVWLDYSEAIKAVSCPPPPGECLTYPDPITDTDTWIVGLGTPRRSRLQLEYELRFLDSRPEALVTREEWALLTLVDGLPTVTSASTEPFRMYVDEVARDAGLLDAEAPTVLLVESANHPHNERYAPTPGLAPFAARMEEWDVGKGRDVWFRAEVDPTGEVDRVVVLGFVPSFPHRDFRTAMKENLRLEYPDERRHRNVVLGKARVSAEGDLDIESSVVVTMPCRCSPGPDCCFCLGETVCPCPSVCS